MTVIWYGAQVLSSVESAKKAALTYGASIVETAAKYEAPVDTGNLRSSITYKVDDDEARVGTNVDYAPHLEYGTVKMAAQPYLRPALDANRAKIQQEMGKIIGKAAEAGGRR